MVSYIVKIWDGKNNLYLIGADCIYWGFDSIANFGVEFEPHFPFTMQLLYFLN